MTCIVGVVKKNKVYIGGDSASVAGWNIDPRKDKKVFRNGEFIIGCTSSYRMIQILQYSFKPPKIDTKDIHEYMCTSFINEMRSVFTELGFMTKGADGDDKGGCFIVGVRGRLFQIDTDFQVGESMRGFNSVGCGSEYALGSLHCTKKEKPKRRIELALQSAAEFSIGVRGPFLIEKG